MFSCPAAVELHAVVSVDNWTDTIADGRMDYITHIRSRNATLAKFDEAEKTLNQLAGKVGQLRNLTSGPHLILHQSVSAVERCRQLSILLKRLHDNRLELLKCDVVEDALYRQHGQGLFAGQEYVELSAKSRELDEAIVLDFETMILFSGMLLDNWAQIAAHVFGKTRPEKNTFDVLAKGEGSYPFEELWSKMHEDILWLDAIPRLYRNKLIVHKEQPWQTGHTRSIFRLDWSFWVPIASGWLSDDEVNEQKELLVALLKTKDIIQTAETMHAMVLIALNNISLFDRTQRSKILDVAARVGFETPTFQKFGIRLSTFVVNATNLLIESTTQNPLLVNTGSKIR